MVDQVVESVGITVVSEFVAGGRKLLQALRCNAGEIPLEFCVFCKYYSPSSDEAVDQRLLRLHHFLRRRKPVKRRTCMILPNTNYISTSCMGRGREERETRRRKRESGFACFSFSSKSQQPYMHGLFLEDNPRT